MKTFETYLQGLGLAASSIAQVQRSLVLCEQKTGVLESLTYQDLLVFVRYLQQSGSKPYTINRHLSSLKHYFSYLILQGFRSDNPAQNLRVKGGVVGLSFQGLDFAALEHLYGAYQGAAELKALLSLYIYQGVKTLEVRHIKVGDVDLTKGELSLRASGVGANQTGARCLALAPGQILLLHQLIGGRSANAGLFVVGDRYDALTQALFEEVRRLNPLIVNAHTIRRVVISHWLKSEDIRLVQHKAGHLRVKSTERYRVAHLEELQQEIARLHPLSD
ncbi:tyrosine-type recombinase/integrase [Microscilla marina]|uniref:Integrase/recombinase, putative n=1 Tax=Microscilla marina ATCC 23134 TaxID=313606 RepID=A2A0J9_MICM2|nr:tyrosine-type recombinase/integrase [Microscilla marina]EAY23839.1 integrase/recombinase, putative [Microscilla marina ATCC 23134]